MRLQILRGQTGANWRISSPWGDSLCEHSEVAPRRWLRCECRNRSPQTAGGIYSPFIPVCRVGYGGLGTRPNQKAPRRPVLPKREGNSRLRYRRSIARPIAQALLSGDGLLSRSRSSTLPARGCCAVRGRPRRGRAKGACMRTKPSPSIPAHVGGKGVWVRLLVCLAGWAAVMDWREGFRRRPIRQSVEKIRLAARTPGLPRAGPGYCVRMPHLSGAPAPFHWMDAPSELGLSFHRDARQRVGHHTERRVPASAPESLVSHPVA